MATEAQILANRRNAQKSTSPRTLSMSLGVPEDLLYAKQSQFAGCSNERKFYFNKGL